MVLPEEKSKHVIEGGIQLHGQEGTGADQRSELEKQINQHKILMRGKGGDTRQQNSAKRYDTHWKLNEHS